MARAARRLLLPVVGVGAAAAIVTAAGAGRPALREVLVVPHTTIVKAGNRIAVTDIVRNTGSRRAARALVRLYLVRGGIRLRLAGRTIPSLRPGGRSRGHTGGVVPPSAAAGAYRLAACVGTDERRAASGAEGCRDADTRIVVMSADSTWAGPIAEWRPSAGFRPLTDAGAAAHVRPAAENRPDNARANRYVPSYRALRAFRRARNEEGRDAIGRDPYLAHVTGHFAGSTDEIIQWAAWKWGIPEDWLRAQYVNESKWHQSTRGDRKYVGPRNVGKYPAVSRERDPDGRYTGFVWLSLGISQIMWKPDGSVNAGTEPLRWKSTAFAADYQAATVRWLFDDPGGTRSRWGDDTYRPGDPWLALGGWFEPYPWRNQGQLAYIATVQRLLQERPWEAGDF